MKSYIAKVIGAIGVVAMTGCGGERFTYRLGKDMSDPENPAKQLDAYTGSRGTLFADYGRNGTLDIKCAPSRCEALTPFEDPTMELQIRRQDVTTDLHERNSERGRKLQKEFDDIRNR